MPRHDIRHRRRPSLKSRLLFLEPLESRQLLALTVQTVPASNITLAGATIGADLVEVGSVNPDLAVYWGDNDGGTFANDWDNAVHFKASPPGQYTVDLTDLNVNTTYYYRAFALSLFGGGLQWTDAASFSTLPPAAPEITTGAVQFVSGTSADVSGEVVFDGGETPSVSVYFGTQDGGEDVTAWDQSVDLGAKRTRSRFAWTPCRPITHIFCAWRLPIQAERVGRRLIPSRRWLSRR